MKRIVPPSFVAAVFATGLAAAAAASAAPVTPCDTLAAHPFDPQKVAPGIRFADIDPVKAIAACTAALKADENNPRLRFELGRALERRGAYVEAAKAYRTAAETGYVAAETALGALYQDGLGVEVDAGMAVAWYHKAADQGYAVAEDNLGIAYRDGAGVVQDQAQAQEWFKKAAAQYYQPAAMHLAETPPPGPAPQANTASPPAVPPPAPSPAPTASAAPSKPSPPPAPVPPPSSPAILPAPAAAAPVTPPAAPAAASADHAVQAIAPPPAPPPMDAPAKAPLVPPSAAAAYIATPPPPVPPPPAPPPPEQTATVAPDPPLKPDVGAALTQCLVPEARNGIHPALDQDQAANLLIAKCQRPWVAWISDCIGHGDSKETCIRRSTDFARNAIKQTAP